MVSFFRGPVTKQGSQGTIKMLREIMEKTVLIPLGKSENRIKRGVTE
jgi:hypothetical protein